METRANTKSNRLMRGAGKTRDMQPEELFRNLFSNSLTGVYIVQHGRFMLVNRKFLSITGYAEETLIGEHSLGIVLPEDRKMVRQYAIEMLKGQRSEPYEYRIIKKDGGINWQMETITPILYQGERAVLGSCMDITASKMANAAIREGAETARTLLDASADQAMLMDIEGEVLAVNETGAEKFGRGVDSLVGSCIFDILPQQVAESRKARIAEVIRSGKPTRFEDRRDGLVINNSIYPIFDIESKVVRLAIFSRDITEQKRSEENIRKYQKKLRSLASELSLTEERERRRIATALHDNIGQNLAMSKIKLAAVLQALANNDLANPLRKVYDLIDETIRYSRSLTTEISPPILYELGFEAAVEWFTEYVGQQRGIKVVFENDGLPKPMDEEIRVMLFTAVRELLVNVAKHAKTQDAKVSIERDDNRILIKVEDNGIGFDPAIVASVRGGTLGYGLFSIRERLNHVGGTLHINSQPGMTRVTLLAPLKRENSKDRKRNEHKNLAGRRSQDNA